MNPYFAHGKLRSPGEYMNLDNIIPTCRLLKMLASSRTAKSFNIHVQEDAQAS